MIGNAAEFLLALVWYLLLAGLAVAIVFGVTLVVFLIRDARARKQNPRPGYLGGPTREALERLYALDAVEPERRGQ